ncbi:hypothetical protein Syun_011262 [Stephania yunnanensis]|uniref:Uncharacterized protein n=1 Tax=Stephania yunnanensis TaxID=152371 RepID=A0AAP0PF95_9MAGN
MSNTNVFAALEALRRKKRSDKERGSSSKKGAGKEAEPQVFWAPTPLTVKSWADVDDDDDYFATTAPPLPVWGSSAQQQQSKESTTPVEESESEDDGLDEVDDDVEEEHEHEHEPEAQMHNEPVVKKPPQVPAAPKEAERQLSKKELKKKELAELEAVLAELGIHQKEETNEKAGPSGVKLEEPNGNEEKIENVPGESKSAKKKKKKDKSTKEIKVQDQSDISAVENGADNEAASAELGEDVSAIDMKERLKKVTSMKKKKSNKEMDTAAKAAAVEAAARSAKLAAAKKKEKNHYNQQPVR